VPAGPDRPGIEFRVLDYGEAHQTVLLPMVEQAGEELPGHPDLKPPGGPELEAAERGAFVVAYVAGRPAASGGYRTFSADPSGDTAELVRMYVHPGARRSGVGRALLGELEALARDDDYRYVVLQVGVEQRAAQALYEITGYRRLPGEPAGEGLRSYRKELPSGAD
jgi:ribosomal protein S18 acetylase RimI-like enzyme